MLVDFEARTMMCSTCGFPAPLLFDSRLNEETLGRPAPPLGWFDEAVAPPVAYPLPESGTILLYSDGLDDVAEQSSMCIPGLADFLISSEDGEIVDSNLLGRQRDDVMAMRFSWHQGTAESSVRVLGSFAYQGNQSEDIDKLQAVWGRLLSRKLPGLSRARKLEMLLACREAVLNAMEHGCCGRADRTCTIKFALAGADRVRVRVTDSGCHIPQERQSRLAGHIPLGTTIIEGISDRVHYDRKNHALVMDFLLNTEESPNPET
jgi:anti-sigma regulatory factor (Ser/Thr protein kinase)